MAGSVGAAAPLLAHSASSSPASPSFPHAQSTLLNGHGIPLGALRPGTSLGHAHLASPPQSTLAAFAPSPSSPSLQLDYAALPAWDDAAVARWLAAALPTLPHEPYADLFAANDLRGAVLLDVDQAALKEMGIRSVGDRVKICVAVRSLRTKYLAATAVAAGGAGAGGGGAGGLSRRPSALGRIAPGATAAGAPGAGGASRPTSPLVPSSASFSASPAALHPNARSGSLSYSARNISVGNRIPPPLHLAQSNAIPSPLHQRSPPSRTTSPRSAVYPLPSTSSSAASALSNARHVPPPPLHPPPSSRIPHPPSSSTSSQPQPSPTGARFAEHIHAPPPPAAQLTSSASTSSLSTRATGGSGAAYPPQGTSGHRKASSSSLASSPVRQTHHYAHQHHHAPQQQAQSPYAGHPYAAAAAGPSGGSAGLLPSAMSAVEHTSRVPMPARSQTTPAGPSSGSAALGAPLSNLEVMRKAVKFTSADGVTSRVLAVADAKDGREVLARVMRKFGGKEGEDVDGWGVWVTEVTGAARLLTEHELYTICQNASAPERQRGLIVRRHHTLPPSAAAASHSLSTSPPAVSSFSQPASPTPGATSSFPLSISASDLAHKRERKLQWVFGESHAASADSSRPGGTVPFPTTSSSAVAAVSSPTSPNYLGVEIPRMGIEPASPPTSGDERNDDDQVLIIGPASSQNGGDAAAAAAAARGAKTKMHRASTVSVMSGLEAPDWARDYYGAGGEGSDYGLDHPDEDEGRVGANAVYSPPQRTSSRREVEQQQQLYSPPSREQAGFSPRSTSAAAMQHPPSTPTSSSIAAGSATSPGGGGSRGRHASLLPDSTRKLRNFFGQRPPSELITNHLTEFFPLGLRGSGSSAGSGGGAGGAAGGAAAGDAAKSERRLLSKQVRASIRKSMSAAAGGTLVYGSGALNAAAAGVGRRYSAASVASRASRASSSRGAGGHVEPLPESKGGTSWEKDKGGDGASVSRFSVSSSGSGPELNLPAPTADPAPSIRSNRSPRSSSGSVLDPPDEAEEEGGDETAAERARISDSPESSIMAHASSSASSSTTNDPDQAETRSLASSLAPSYLDARPRRLSRRLSRLSGSSRLSVGAQSLWERRSKDSDAASIITVDEVTAELETRRASGVSWRASMSGGGGGPHDSDDEGPSEVESEFEDDLSDEDHFSEEESDEDYEEEPGTAKPETKGMKWIKGALIGAGSFGSVFLGMNPMTGSLMAVKQVELPTGNSHNEERKKGMLEALEREIELLKVLQHDNIVQYLDSSTDDKHLNIFLEYVPGGSVAALLQNYGAFEEALVSKFVRQILTGLDYLHEREIIHRDIKGANILVDNKGNIKISDFGISKKVEDNLLTGAKVHRPSLQGSVYWMAPEVVKQTAYTSKADIWSLGCLVVEMLTGAHPWANLTQMQAIFRIGSSSRPTVPDDISNDADDFLDQTFEIEHMDRPSARELLQHAFIRDPDAWMASQQTPTRATFLQQAGAAADAA
ncbi:hypothetical protein Rhopal_003658-T1 [Rhodotorula paludigena]|uniref:mitogen-activated protein kinase kinase kinase n=1 Tax=Rhodotorula paludigena TaxID=86838 RepID=A0AAV5GDN0_9BASI|nr:hypothetical protein Rhopal_003658-T1 [Rhodotorula paludigena]